MTTANRNWLSLALGRVNFAKVDADKKEITSCKQNSHS